MSKTPRLLFNRKLLGRSEYANLRVKGDHRASATPRIARPHRHKFMAWRGILAFYSDGRFYERDRFYKAYIPMPRNHPDMKIIRPELFTKSLAELMQDEKYYELGGAEIVDIGLPFEPKRISLEERSKVFSDNKLNLERASRLGTLTIDPKEIESENYEFRGPEIMRQWATHMNIFSDLFHPHSYFNPIVSLTIEYENAIDSQDEIEITPLFWGNQLLPNEAVTPPNIFYPSESHEKWTIVAVNPDGNIYKENGDVIHWMISNIQGNDISTGTTIYPYLQPLPFKGTGYHRFVYLLFKHQDAKDLEIKPVENADFQSRCEFVCSEFYKRNEDVITPAGFGVGECKWDESVVKAMHKLGELHPIFEHAEMKIKPEEQEKVPWRSVPFNEYLDKYRSQQEVDEEIFRKRLEKVNPFGKVPEIPKYPGLNEYEDRICMSSWEKIEKRKMNLALGKYEKIYRNVIE